MNGPEKAALTQRVFVLRKREPSLCINSGACTGIKYPTAASRKSSNRGNGFLIQFLQLLSVQGTGCRTSEALGEPGDNQVNSPAVSVPKHGLQLSGGRETSGIYEAFTQADCGRTEAQSLEEGG